MFVAPFFKAYPILVLLLILSSCNSGFQSVNPVIFTSNEFKGYENVDNLLEFSAYPHTNDRISSIDVKIFKNGKDETPAGLKIEKKLKSTDQLSKIKFVVKYQGLPAGDYLVRINYQISDKMVNEKVPLLISKLGIAHESEVAINNFLEENSFIGSKIFFSATAENPVNDFNNYTTIINIDTAQYEFSGLIIPENSAPVPAADAKTVRCTILWQNPADNSPVEVFRSSEFPLKQQPPDINLSNKLYELHGSGKKLSLIVSGIKINNPDFGILPAGDKFVNSNCPGIITCKAEFGGDLQENIITTINCGVKFGFSFNKIKDYLTEISDILPSKSKLECWKKVYDYFEGQNSIVTSTDNSGCVVYDNVYFKIEDIETFLSEGDVEIVSEPIIQRMFDYYIIHLELKPKGRNKKINGQIVFTVSAKAVNPANSIESITVTEKVIAPLNYSE